MLSHVIPHYYSEKVESKSNFTFQEVSFNFIILFGQHATIDVHFRAPNFFKAGEPQNLVATWDIILRNCHQKETVAGYISRGVNVMDFLPPVKGGFKGCSYGSRPPEDGLYEPSFL